MDIRKQVSRNNHQEAVYHSDVELVDRIPDDPQDHDEEDSSNDEDQSELNDGSNLEDNCDDLVDFADDSLASEDQDPFVLKTATDTICLNDNIEKSGNRSAKNRKKKS